MSKYWPDRSHPEGFSIEKLAKSYREKITHSHSKAKFKDTLEPIQTDSHIESDHFSHWANRSFEEYEYTS